MGPPPDVAGRGSAYRRGETTRRRWTMPNALITGASRGLGRALAGALAERGWGLVIDARGAGELEEARREIDRGGNLVARVGDVADAWHRDELRWAAAGMGGLDAL